MAEAIVDNRTCSKCGAEVREGTAFCYACGEPVARDSAGISENVTDERLEKAAPIDVKTQSALDDLAEKLSSTDAPEKSEKLAKAASERKKARVTQRKTREFVWEPRDETPQGLLITTAAAFVLAVFVVVVLVVWK
jgi:predicted amidophosphoribosyltransferase